MSAAQQRRAMVAGMTFVVLFVAGVLVNFGDTPEIKSSDTGATAAQKWLSELSSSGHRIGLLVGGYLLILAAIAFVWFCVGLREWLISGTSAGRLIAGLSAVGAAAMCVASVVGAAGIAGGVEFGENPLPQNGD